MQHLVALGFWVFLTTAAVAGIVADYKKRSLVVAPLKAAIERGQQLDPLLIERLMAPEKHDSGFNPLYLRVGGIIVVAAGVGVALLSFFVGQLEPLAIFPVLGAGVAAICVGIGLLVSARVVETHNRTRASGTPSGA